MERKIMKSLVVTFFCITMCFWICNTAYADMGPKPSVVVTFDGLGDEECYGTLLSKSESTGPSSVWDGTEDNAMHNENERFYYLDFDYDIWKAFVEYDDLDGFYFLQEAWRINETKELAWTYYPPKEFKILLYFPKKEIFVVSDIYERYAFDSYYTVEMDGIDISSAQYNEELSGDVRIEAYRSYDYVNELLSLFIRILITIAIEMLIALAFCFREKLQLVVLAIVNSATQIILNVLLNIINYNSGEVAFLRCYVFYEIIVFVIEAVVLSIVLNRVRTKKKAKWFITLYAFIANLVSFLVGVFLAQWLPTIF